MVYTQFHVNKNGFFKTVQPTAGNQPTISQWQHISGFKKYRPHHIQKSEGGSSPDMDILDQAKKETISSRKDDKIEDIQASDRYTTL